MDPLEIGYVIAVEGDSVEVQISVSDLRLDYHGKMYRVGRLGTYVTIPMDRRTLIGYITRVGAAGDLNPGPNPETPTRITVTCQLLGTVQGDKFSRGVNEYPTLGDLVRLGVDEDFELIFGAFDELADDNGTRKAFSMGRFAIDTDFEVKVLGKDFFAKHVAVMGNSGSGKSVTTAKIVYEATKLPHSQIVMFDMHGEYLKAFSDDFGNPLPNVTYLSDRNLVLPYWMMSFEEFEQLFIDSYNPVDINAQRIFLRQAFEQLKAPSAEVLGLQCEFTIDTPVYYSLEQLQTYVMNMNAARFVTNTDNYAFSRLPYRQLPREEQDRLLLSQLMEFNPAASEGETPHATYNGKLLGLINSIETKLNDRRYDFLLRPFEQANRNEGLGPHFHKHMPLDEKSLTVGCVIKQLLGRLDERKNLTIIDLSGLPFDVVDTTVAVITRALFDFNFWSPPDVRHPVLMVYEEAHNYLPRKPIEGRKTFARNAVEKVAKEGRKYGVAAMIVSQRPSEISETVLSQANSMILMRMNNPDDQEYAARVVSDQFRSLINLLPSMKPGEGFIIGDAVLMPMRTLIDMPPKEPQSANMDFFGLWSSGGKGCDVDHIVGRWWRQERSAVVTDSDSSDKQTESQAESKLPAVASNAACEPEASKFVAQPPEVGPPPEMPVKPEAAEVSVENSENTSVGPVEEQPEAAMVEERAKDEKGSKSRAERKLAQLAALLGGGKAEE